YAQYDIAEYEALPFSDSKLSDLLLRNVGASRDSIDYKVDLSINRDEHTVESDYYVRSRITDIGDLKENYGYVDFDADGYHFMPGNVYPKVVKGVGDVSPEQAMEWLRQGYYAIQVANAPENRHHSLPLMIFSGRAP